MPTENSDNIFNEAFGIVFHLLRLSSYQYETAQRSPKINSKASLRILFPYPLRPWKNKRKKRLYTSFNLARASAYTWVILRRASRETHSFA